MSIEVKCGGCGRTIRAPEKFAGKRARCPGCKAPIDIPQASSAGDSSDPLGSMLEEYPDPFGSPSDDAFDGAPNKKKSDALGGLLDEEFTDDELTAGDPLAPAPAAFGGGRKKARARKAGGRSRGSEGDGVDFASFMASIGRRPIWSAFLLAAGGLVVFVLLLPISFWLAAYWAGLFSTIGTILFLVTAVWSFVIALDDLGPMGVVALVFLPFLNIGYVVANWHRVREPFWVMSIACTMMVGPVVGVFAGGYWYFISGGFEVAENQEDDDEPRQDKPPEDNRRVQKEREDEPPRSHRNFTPRIEEEERELERPPFELSHANNRKEPPGWQSQSVDPEQPSPPDNPNSIEFDNAENTANTNNAPVVAVPKIWNCAPDPPVTQVEFPKDLNILVPDYFRLFGTNVFPCLPSPFVAMTRDSREGAQAVVWNFETKTQLGGVSGPQDSFYRDQVALSPDGKHLAAQRGQRDGERGAHVGIWSVDRGEHLFDIAVHDKTWIIDHMGFTGPNQLLTAVQITHGVQQVRLWDVADGQLGREFLVESDKWPELCISPNGRFLAAVDEYLRVYDLTTGLLAGARPFPDAAPNEKWVFHGAAFSHDGTELAALFDVGESMKVVVWDFLSGEVLTHLTAEGTWYPKIEGFKRYDGRKLEWFADKQGWVVAGYVAIRREDGQGAWMLKREPSEPARLVDGRFMVGRASEGFVNTLVASETSLDKPPRLEIRSNGQSPNPLASVRGLVGVVRLEIRNYTGQGDPTAAARSALTSVGWADAKSVHVDLDAKVIHIGVRVMSVNTASAASALSRAGFETGRTQFSPIRR